MFKKFKYKVPALALALSILLSACGQNSVDGDNTESDVNETTATSEEVTETEGITEESSIGETEAVTEEESLTEVEINDLHGLVVVPVEPQTVVSLDSRTFETLEAWGIKLAAAPKAVMPADCVYVDDESVLDIGNHREPNLEIVAAVEPDLVIIGQRFANYYEEIKTLVPDAVVIDLNFDVSEAAATPGENLTNGLKNATLNLGKIFNKNTEAEALVTELDDVIEEVRSAYNGSDTIMSVIVSGGNIGHSAPLSGRVFGPMYEIFDWEPSLLVEDSTSDHQGDNIHVEAIAQANPDWILVLDRDAAVSSTEDAVPAQDIIDNAEALQNTTAVKEDRIVYAPNDTYTNESIHTFIELFNTLADAFR